MSILDGPWTQATGSGADTLVLIRHGRTAWNAEQRFLGRSDVPLDDVGHAEARTLAERIGRPFGRLYTSPLSRAAQTAGYLHDAPEAVSDLQELDQGELEGLSGPEAFARFPDFFRAWREDPTAMACPGGEALPDCQERCWTAVNGLLDAHRRDVVAAVAHQFVIASVVCAATDTPLGQWRRWGVRNTAVTVLNRSSAGWTLLAHDWLGDAG